jgi:hypothetical protein
LRWRAVAARQRHQRTGYGRDQGFDAVVLGVSPALAHRQRAAGLYDRGAERKALAARAQLIAKSAEKLLEDEG